MIQVFLQWIKENRLTASICPSCKAKYFPPKSKCSLCTVESELVELPKRGTVLTYSEVHVSDGKFKTPYVVAIAELGGFKVPAIVLDARYEDVEIGDEVEVVFGDSVRKSEGIERWYCFRLVDRRK